MPRVAMQRAVMMADLTGQHSQLAWNSLVCQKAMRISIELNMIKG